MRAYLLVPKAAGVMTPFVSALQVQLSCYGDSVGGDLKALKSFLDSNVKGSSLVPFLCVSRMIHADALS